MNTRERERHHDPQKQQTLEKPAGGASARRHAYRDKKEAHFSELDTQIESLKAEAATYRDEGDHHLHERMKAVDRKRGAVHARLRALKEAGEEAWDELQDGVEDAWDELEDAYEDLREGISHAASRPGNRGKNRRH